MMGSFLTRGLLMILGYAYPAYDCFKTVEKNKPEIEQLRFWCQYWILVAILTVLERVGDAFISWLPMYSEAKLTFFIYLWYPKTRGTTYIYDSFLRPYVAKHETDIDRNLLELRTRAGDMLALYWQKAASYGQTRIYEVLQFVALQSASRPASSQQKQSKVYPPPPVLSSACTSAPQQTQEAPLNSGTAQRENEQLQIVHNASRLLVPSVSQGPDPSPGQVASQSGETANRAQTPVDASGMTDERLDANAQCMDGIDESARVTRARLRKTRASTNR